VRCAGASSAQLLFFRHEAVYSAVMIRALAFALLLMVTPAIAQTAKDSATIEVAPAKPAEPVDPVKKRAEDLDRMFAELHKQGSTNARQTIEKIWVLWARNDSPTAELLLTQAGKAVQDGAFNTSEDMLNTLIGTYPDYVEALNKRALLYYNQKRYDEAIEDLNAVLDNEPRHFSALVGLAAVYQAQGDPSKAAASLRDAIAINPYFDSAKEALKALEKDFPNI
jgi:tetratricopeptide (TPR) repeat protein